MIRRFLLALAVPLAITVACTTYTADDTTTKDAGTKKPTPPPSSTSIVDGSTPPPVSLSDAGDAATLPDCPVCPAGETCVDVACRGAGTATTCATPMTVANGATVTVLMCPGAETQQIPMIAAAPECEGTRPAVAFTLPSGNWNLSVNDSTFFYFAQGKCNEVIACGTGTGNDSVPPGGATLTGDITVGPHNPLTSCITFRVTFTKAS